MAYSRPSPTSTGSTSSPGDGPKPPPNSRRAQLASLEAERKKDARRRSLVLVLACVVLAAAVLAYPVYALVSDAIARGRTIEQIGAPLAAAACDPVQTHQATGNQDHVPDGTKVNYDRFPPDSGPHYAVPAEFTKKFYTPADRPPVEELVHNLEHGYTVAWYRPDLAGQQLRDLKDIAKRFAGQTGTDKFIAAPWEAADGDPLPEGKNVVLAHWSANPADPGDQAQQVGVRQACGAVSGAAVKEFTAKYPFSASPEPNGA